jgi:hypothetical protein
MVFPTLHLNALLSTLKKGAQNMEAAARPPANASRAGVRGVEGDQW